jgi:hypothetical protein
MTQNKVRKIKMKKYRTFPVHMGVQSIPSILSSLEFDIPLGGCSAILCSKFAFFERFSWYAYSYICTFLCVIPWKSLHKMALWDIWKMKLVVYVVSREGLWWRSELHYSHPYHSTNLKLAGAQFAPPFSICILGVGSNKALACSCIMSRSDRCQILYI